MCVQLLALSPPPLHGFARRLVPPRCPAPPSLCAPPPHCTTTCTSPYHPTHTQPSAQQQGKPVCGGRDGGWGACARAGGGGAVPPARPASLSLSLQAAPPCLHHHHHHHQHAPPTGCLPRHTRASRGGGRTASPASRASPARPWASPPSDHVPAAGTLRAREGPKPRGQWTLGLPLAAGTTRPPPRQPAGKGGRDGGS